MSQASTITYTPPVAQQRVGQLLSYLLHPLFLPLLMGWWLLYQHPVYPLLANAEQRIRWVAMLGVVTLFLPAFVVFLLWRLQFISNVYLRSQRERIIPLNVCILFYFWAYYVLRNLEGVPPALVQWSLGVFIASAAALFTNIFFKISLHTLGFGGLVGFVAWQTATDAHWPPALLPWVLIVAGLAGTARLACQAHKPGEVYAGYLAGVICQVAAGLAS